MLVYFRCRNFLSFKEDAVLDMRAVKAYKEHPYNLIEDENRDLLKVVSIYGANASGKSNFVEAYITFQKIVRNSFKMNNKNENQGSVLAEYYNPYLLCSDTQNEDTQFEIIACDDQEEYRYGFVYNRDRIEEEWLYRRSLTNSRTVTILERTGSELELGASVKKNCEKYVPEVDDDVLALSFFSGLSLSNKVFEKTANLIMDILPIRSSEMMEKILLDRYFLDVYSDEEKKHLLMFLHAIDVGIVDIRVERIPNKRNYEVYMIHHDENGLPCSFPMGIESQGTIKAISLFTVMRMVAVMNKVIIMDEFNTKLHPLLQKYLIDRFYEGTESGQFIFTTHDTFLLDRKYTRRDQVWFVEKDNSGQSSMYSLSDFKVRNDRSFEKDYLAGIYGAIPMLKDYSFAEV